MTNVLQICVGETLLTDIWHSLQEMQTQ